MNRELARELLTMRDHDLRVREELARDGSLFNGYHPRMEEVHVANAARLKQIIAEHGWPGRSLVGEEAANAAWLIVQHAIGDPAFQRGMLEVLTKEVVKGEAQPAEVAFLEDRICLFEGRPQLYGTQFDWNEGGEMAPSTIADPDHVDERRARVGLEPMAQRMAKLNQDSNERPPEDWHKRQQEFEAWAKRVGWRS